MKQTIILCTSNRGVRSETRSSIDACRARGAQYVEHGGCSDVTLARNLALSAVWRHNQKGTFRRAASAAFLDDIVPDTLLMVDDDMVFTVETVEALITHARTHGEPASAMYATTLGTLAATRWPIAPGFWMVGLGLIAIPLKLLNAIAEELPRFTMGTDGDEQVAFTQSEWIPKQLARGATDGSALGAWSSEDYTLCRRLGGVRLLPVAAGHLKQIPLWPDDETIEKIRSGAELEQYDGKSRMPPVVSELGERR